MAGSVGRAGGNRRQGIDATKPDGGPIMPRGIGKGVAKKWRELVDQIPSNVLRRIDGHQLAGLARLLVLSDSLWARVESTPGDIQARRMFLQTTDRIGKLSSQFGLSPSDRQRMKIDPQDDQDDEFEKWLRGEDNQLDPAEEYRAKMRGLRPGQTN